MAHQQKSAAKCPYQASKDLEYENRIQAAIEDYKRGLYMSYAEAARLNNVARHTLHDQVKGVHKTYQQGQEKKQLLSAAEESVLLDWTQHYGTMANPLCPKKLRSCVHGILGKIPGKHWHYRKQKGSYRISDDNLELVTVIEHISAAGVLMKPGFVLKEGPLPDLSAVEGIGRPVVLTLNGHDPHEQPPLDVVVFARVGRSWSSHTNRIAIEGIKIDCYNIVPEYLSIRHVITPELICTAFKETGIYPFNPNIFTEGDFAPSQVMSTSAHFPDSYPSDIDTSNKSFHTSDGSNESDTESDLMWDDSPPGLLGLTALPGPTVELDGYHDQEPSQECLCHHSLLLILSSIVPLNHKLAVPHPSPSPSQLGLDVFPSPTPSDRVCEWKEIEWESPHKHRKGGKSLVSYKRKEDLIVIAGALGLPIDGTVKALIERIKSHLQGHKELADNPRFAGLFGRRVQAPEGSSHSGQSSQSPLYSSVNSSTAFSPQSVQTPYFLATQSQFPDPTFYNGFSGPGCSTPGPSYNFNISERVLPPPTDGNGVTITYYNELGQPYYVW
ncbi:hypothetical protein SERLADRAFT_407756 [Serpula lacrymans var. lacrymans S7.9]|uniref:HTH psq-type domain-containing protein n=1 Tax=Serpula lacrymans var. lacrymans (strain S7.9) TaxID=578457 RepID=F8NV62_SERL9|nr:uncharacterized protein SERLADRAFT_407756 [Serpula lacrymans var. lacrymans S7.9]EGO25324.1 hypothetical protein SERLADRAFT_407756 [Serpula lacrymans var. lacrymans S7.9]